MQFTPISIAEANARIRPMYERHAKLFGYDPEGHWGDCDLFALLRLRGLCHTIYVVHNAPDDYHWSYYIVDLHTDGGPRSSAEISEPFTSWGDAVLAATRKLIFGDPEIGEGLTADQRASLRDTDADRWAPVDHVAGPFHAVP